MTVMHMLGLSSFCFIAYLYFIAKVAKYTSKSLDPLLEEEMEVKTLPGTQFLAFLANIR